MRILVTITGQDRPGITAEMTGLLARNQATLIDMGQAVIHGLLSLFLLFEAKDGDESALKDLLLASAKLGMRAEFQTTPQAAAPAPSRHRYSVTLLADPLKPEMLRDVLQKLAQAKLNIDRIQRLSGERLQCLEFQVSSSEPIDTHALKLGLLQLSNALGMDIALQSDGLFRRSKRLVVFDMDSTLIAQEVIDEFAREMDVYAQVAEITHKAMRGELNYEQSLNARCSLLKGLTLEQVQKVAGRLTLNAGAAELMQTLRKLGYKTAIVSGGFNCITDRFREQLGMDASFANTMEFERGVFTGRVLPPIVHAERKADLLESLAFQERISLEQVVAVGDGANDILMLQKAGLGIAYNAKPVVNERAHVAMRTRSLMSILFLLGIHERDIAQS